MRRPEWVRKMIADELSEEEILENLMKGNINAGINPVSGKTEEERKKFANLIYKKIIKKM